MMGWPGIVISHTQRKKDKLTKPPHGKVCTSSCYVQKDDNLVSLALSWPFGWLISVVSSVLYVHVHFSVYLRLYAVSYLD